MRPSPKSASQIAHRSALRDSSVAESLISRVCERLYYRTETNAPDWAPLSQWSRFLIQMGAVLYSTADPKRRIVASFSLPTRAYAAALLSLGAVLAHLSSDPESATDEAHTQSLRALAKGAPVRLCRGNRLLKGRFLGFEEFEGKLLARVQVESTGSGALEYQIAQNEWTRIRISTQPTGGLPDRQKGRRNDAGEMLTAMLGASPALHHTLEPDLCSVIVGRANLLVFEINHTSFCYRASDSCCVSGGLQEILRARRFLGESMAYRTDIVPISGAPNLASQKDKIPHLTVFDGSHSYLKCRHLWPNSHAAVILDRTDVNFGEATQIINQVFVQRRLGKEWSQQKLPAIPEGIEVMVYEEVRR